jgi:hypothetical protein
MAVRLQYNHYIELIKGKKPDIQFPYKIKLHISFLHSQVRKSFLRLHSLAIYIAVQFYKNSSNRSLPSLTHVWLKLLYHFVCLFARLDVTMQELLKWLLCNFMFDNCTDNCRGN